MAEANERYHRVEHVVTGIIEGLAMPPNEPGVFTGINMDLHVTLEDGSPIVGRFLISSPEAAELLADMLREAAVKLREKLG